MGIEYLCLFGVLTMYLLIICRIDLFKYPGLYNIEHYFAFLEPGDCLYVPFLW